MRIVGQAVSLRRAGSRLVRVWHYLAFLAVILLSPLAIAQDFSVVKVDVVGDHYTFTEGPAWSKDGYLIFSDTPADRLLKWIPGHAIEVFREKANGPSGNAFTNKININTVGIQTYVIDNLSSGDWVFALTAVNSAGVESALSGPVEVTL